MSENDGREGSADSCDWGCAKHVAVLNSWVCNRTAEKPTHQDDTGERHLSSHERRLQIFQYFRVGLHAREHAVQLVALASAPQHETWLKEPGPPPWLGEIRRETDLHLSDRNFGSQSSLR
jgi:hypothetical protein